MTWQTAGLIWFIAVHLGTSAVLAFDWWLEASGRQTISGYTRRTKWPAFVLLVVLASGWAGLAVHLMGT